MIVSIMPLKYIGEIGQYQTAAYVKIVHIFVEYYEYPSYYRNSPCLGLYCTKQLSFR